jgi:hypothetical protein
MDIAIVIAVVLIAVCVVAILLPVVLKVRRKRQLAAKYGDAVVAERIMTKKIWQGMTREQLLESWGNPADIDRKVYKTKEKETLSYNQVGKNRYRDKVQLEDGIVVGWDQK